MKHWPYDDGLVRYRLALANLQTITGVDNGVVSVSAAGIAARRNR